MLDNQQIDSLITDYSIIDKIGELALTKALKSGKIYAAGLDVLSEEPATKNIEFFQLDNVRITQHIAWGSQETNLRAIAIALDNLSITSDQGATDEY